MKSSWAPPSAKVIKALRKDVLGFGSAEAAARELGISTNHYARIEAGAAKINETAWRLMVCLARVKDPTITIDWRAA